MKSKNTALIFFTVILLSSSTFASITASYHYEKSNQTTSIVIGPYPQKPDLNSIEILWETNEKTIKNEVHWGLTPDLGNVSTENAFLKRYLHKVRLDGLTPSTKYYYKVVSDDIESEIYSFYTSFEPNKAARFIAYGDSRGVWDNWQNANIVAQAIGDQHPYFVLHTGDLVYNGKNKSQWTDFYSISEFIHNSTLYPVLGNHEHYGIYYFKYFSLPHNERWYSFDNGPIHFIALDSDPRNTFKLSQLFWLIRDLRLNDQTFNVVFFHHPMYSSGNHGSTIYLRWLWKPVFENYGVDIVFNGHDHSYERGKVNNVNYIVTGGGGAPLYDVGRSWWTMYSEKTYHYCLINANQSQLTFQALKPDGTIIDSFVTCLLN